MSETRHQDFSDFQSPHEASVERLVQALDRAYHRPWLMLWRSFLQGLMASIGAIVGTTLFITLSLYIFQVMGGLTLLKPFIQQLQDMLIPVELRASNLQNSKSLNNLLDKSTPTPTSTPQ